MCDTEELWTDCKCGERKRRIEGLVYSVLLKRPAKRVSNFFLLEYRFVNALSLIHYLLVYIRVRACVRACVCVYYFSFLLILCNRVYCIPVSGHDPLAFSFRSFSFFIGWEFYGPNYLRC